MKTTDLQDEAPVILNEAVCDHGGKVHGVESIMAERDEAGSKIRVGPVTYCGDEVGLCEVRNYLRPVGTQTKITCDCCLDHLRIALGDKADMVFGTGDEEEKPKEKKPKRDGRQWWRRKKRKKRRKK